MVIGTGNSIVSYILNKNEIKLIKKVEIGSTLGREHRAAAEELKVYDWRTADPQSRIYTLSVAGKSGLIYVLVMTFTETGVLDVKMKSIMSGHGGEVTALRFNPTHCILASGSLDKTIRLWSTGSEN